MREVRDRFLLDAGHRRRHDRGGGRLADWSDRMAPIRPLKMPAPGRVARAGISIGMRHGLTRRQAATVVLMAATTARGMALQAGQDNVTWLTQVARWAETLGADRNQPNGDNREQHNHRDPGGDTAVPDRADRPVARRAGAPQDQPGGAAAAGDFPCCASGDHHTAEQAGQ